MLAAVEWKDVVVLIGILLTFGLGIGNLIYNLLNNRRTTFINAVTAERVKWINTLRENLSKFAGHIFNYAAVAHQDEEASQAIWRETDRLRLLIKLQLNPKEPLDQDIERMLDKIYFGSKGIGGEAAMALVDELIRYGQRLLNRNGTR